MHLVIGALSKDPVVDPEEDPCPRASLLNKVLERVPFTQGPDRIHIHLLIMALTQHVCDSRGNPISPGNRQRFVSVETSLY